MLQKASYFHLLRHGECEGGGIFRGSTDVNLTDAGWRSMQSACNKPDQPFTAVYSSPLKRCKLFAEKYARDHQLPVHIDARLREMHFGDWDGKPIDEISERFSKDYQTWLEAPSQYCPPNAEPMHEVLDRLREFYKELQTKDISENLLIITHGGVIRLLVADMLQMSLDKIGVLDIAYASLSTLSVYEWEGKVINKLLRLNCCGGSLND